MFPHSSMLIAGRDLTWNPADKAPSVTLSNNNRTMSPSVASSGVRARTPRSTGKYYYESRWDVGLGVTGIMTGATVLANGVWVGSDATGYGYAADGRIYSSDVPALAGDTLAAGDIVGVAVDFGVATLWVAKNGVWQNGDPAAGTGGRPITPGTYYPAASGQAGSQQTGRWHAAHFTYSPPSGFRAWGLR